MNEIRKEEKEARWKLHYWFDSIERTTVDNFGRLPTMCFNDSVQVMAPGQIDVDYDCSEDGGVTLEISVRDSNVKSLEGIGALPHLVRADFGGGGVPIHTLSWLKEIDFTYVETPDENGDIPHFDLSIDWWELKDDEYQYLALVPEFSYLNINGHAASKWVEVLKDKRIWGINAQECDFDNETFKTFIEQHPELSEITITNNPRLTDLSILLTLKNLRNVWISDNMQKARDSLGDGYQFWLGDN